MPDHPCLKPVHSRRERRMKERSENEKSCVSPSFSMEAFLNEHCHPTRCSLFRPCSGTEVSLLFLGGALTAEQLGQQFQQGRVTLWEGCSHPGGPPAQHPLAVMGASGLCVRVCIAPCAHIYMCVHTENQMHISRIRNYLSA